MPIPGGELPPELDSGLITTPIGPFGLPGVPMQPAAFEQQRQAAIARGQVQVNVDGVPMHPGTGMNPAANVFEHVAPVSVDGVMAPPPAAAPPAPMPPPVQQGGVPGQGGIAPQVNVPTPVPHAGSHAQPNFIPEFEKLQQQQINREQVAGHALEAAQLEGGEANAAAIADKVAKQQQLAGELLAKQKQVQEHNAALDAIDAANLQKAKEATIPDFWKGQTGKLVGATISVALAGLGAGLLGSTNNQAMQAIQHNVDQYFHREKDKIDNLYRYAEAQGKLNTQTRMQYAQDLLNLKDQHSYVLQAAADHIQEVAAKSKGAADAAATNFLTAKLGEQAVQGFKDVRELRSKMMLQEAQATQAQAAAAEHRARAAQGGYFTKLTPQQQVIAERLYAPFHKEAIGQGAQPGPVTKLAAVEKVKAEFNEAMASGDPNRIKAATTEIIEKVGPLLAGGRTTANLTNMIKDMNTLGGKIQENIGKMTGSNPVGKEYAARMHALLDSSAHQAKEMAGEVRERAVRKYLGPNGMANTPALKDQFINDLEGTFGTATYNGQPLFQNNPNTPARPAAPAAAPAPASGGRPAAMTLPNGTVVHLNPATGQYE